MNAIGLAHNPSPSLYDEQAQERADADHEASIERLRKSLASDVIGVGELIEACDSHWWLIHAASYAVITGDFQFLTNEWAKHVPALIEADVAERVS